MFADLSGIKSDPFLSLFKKNLRDNFRIKKKHKILLCVSGGLDSMVLLFLFLAIKYYRIQVAHVNYNLRKEADDEMNFVKQISEKFNIPFFSSTFNAEVCIGTKLGGLPRKKGISILNVSVRRV